MEGATLNLLRNAFFAFVPYVSPSRIGLCQIINIFTTTVKSDHILHMLIVIKIVGICVVCMRACVRACECVCVCVRARACVRACVCGEEKRS